MKKVRKPSNLSGARPSGVERGRRRAEEWRDKFSFRSIVGAVAVVGMVLWLIVGCVSLLNVTRLIYLQGSVVFWLSFASGFVNVVAAAVLVTLAWTGVASVHKAKDKTVDIAAVEAAYMLEDRHFTLILSLTTAVANGLAAALWGLWFIENAENASQASLAAKVEQYASFMAMNALSGAMAFIPLFIVFALLYAAEVRRISLGALELVVLRYASRAGTGSIGSRESSLREVMAGALAEMRSSN